MTTIHLRDCTVWQCARPISGRTDAGIDVIHTTGSAVERSATKDRPWSPCGATSSAGSTSPGSGSRPFLTDGEYAKVFIVTMVELAVGWLASHLWSRGRAETA
ncbi:hypothetical protein ABT297_28600, partial [Dactylosporangium sp. NPDC000555]|uniref:hypothetical protein n=1 Tax=Dactylosporangium sp. NPDC000555 TaxID=3154260 RepID=UPI00331AB127